MPYLGEKTNNPLKNCCNTEVLRTKGRCTNIQSSAPSNNEANTAVSPI